MTEPNCKFLGKYSWSKPDPKSVLLYKSINLAEKTEIYKGKKVKMKFNLIEKLHVNQ